jgi:hypothetical protein
MKKQLTKVDVARYQLGTAMDLFIRDRDPVAVQSLACGGAELIEAIATLENVEPLSTHTLKTVPGLDMKELRTLQRPYWNAFKHMNDRGGAVRDDSETLAAFNDTKNDAALFVGWWDYYAVTKMLPLPVQVFELWWYALNEGKLVPETDMAEIRRVFPNIVKDSRGEQKRRLRRTVEKYRHDKEVLGDPRTEIAPLCVSARLE